MTVIDTAPRKSPDAFRTISEVAADLDVPQHVLRFWESKFSQIRPLKRGGGRRYYRPEDVDLLRGVRALLYKDGYTIKGVQKVFKDQGVRFIVETGRGVGEASVAGLARAAVETMGDDVPASASASRALEEADESDEELREALTAIAKRLRTLKTEIDRGLSGEPEDF
ncbi:MAG: MerR family transcriptional regulator [Alphaproteobacteria bacterium]|mgnify:CR=1 FL=1|nr:MerR family transcriptional regulator [Alphaproteobacteria bacterium]MBO6629017.1 MerR family transcriptional regulator [Alphaproteobacteria bacterium]MDF1624848.1 MerR family transcriptional regulator [Parvibaculaceae bacterium]